MAIPRVLLVDNDENVRITLQKVLELNGFEVATATGVREALYRIRSEQFNVLLCDLHIPGPGNSLSVVSALRHANPQAVTLVLCCHLETAAETKAILLQADEIVVKPFIVPELIESIRQKLVSHNSESAVRATETVANILESASSQIIQDWLMRVENHQELMRIPLSSEGRTGHLPQLVRDLAACLSQPPQSADGKHRESKAAHDYGRLRRMQGYSASLIVEESRLLEVSIFQMLQNNLARLDFSMVLLDVMKIAGEVDSQLGQAIHTFTDSTREYSAT